MLLLLLLLLLCLGRFRFVFLLFQGGTVLILLLESGALLILRFGRDRVFVVGFALFRWREARIPWWRISVRPLRRRQRKSTTSFGGSSLRGVGRRRRGFGRRRYFRDRLWNPSFPSLGLNNRQIFTSDGYFLHLSTRGGIRIFVFVSRSGVFLGGVTRLCPQSPRRRSSLEPNV